MFTAFWGEQRAAVAIVAAARIIGWHDLLLLLRRRKHRFRTSVHRNESAQFRILQETSLFPQQ
jgi:hypothetical protein